MDGGAFREGSCDLFLYDRKRAELDGVTDVSSLSDASITADCKWGAIEISGRGLKILSFSTDTGKLTICGTVDSVVYYDDAPDTGWKSRLFGKK
ncbi:MAG: YabP/YqfC family sporulation protein [Clostridia bacterium]|nr:YabP/YqfC family sporulation protein [Clostridia bacterium]